MRNILTQTFVVPRVSADNLDTLLQKAEDILIAQKKQPVRVILLDVTDTEAVVLASILYEVPR